MALDFLLSEGLDPWMNQAGMLGTGRIRRTDKEEGDCVWPLPRFSKKAAGICDCS